MGDPTVYAIVVRGHITERLAASFDGMAIEPGHPNSVIRGPSRDQAHLMGVIQAVGGLGLELISVTPEQMPSSA